MQKQETQRRPERFPLSQLALTSWRYDLSPDHLDMLAEGLREAAAQMRAIGLGKAVPHA